MLKFLKNALPRLAAQLSGRRFTGKPTELGSIDALSTVLTLREKELYDILVRFSNQDWVDHSLLSYTMPATLTRLLRWRRDEFAELKQEYEKASRLLESYRYAVFKVDRQSLYALDRNSELNCTDVKRNLDEYVESLYELRDLNQSDAKATDATDQVQRPEGS